MPFSVAFMRKLDSADPGFKDILWSLLEEIERDREESVTKKEFGELSEIVRRLGKTVWELAEAQKQLAEAQKRTEMKVEELALAQKRTEMKVEELALAQKRTEQELHELVGEHRKTRQQLGGLTMTVGYGLENAAYPKLPDLLHRDFGLAVQERLVRRFVKDKKGNDIEVNIFGKATRDGEDVVIVGEAKSQLSKNDIKRFLRKKVKPLEGMSEHMFLVLVTHMIADPGVETCAREKDIALYYSYDFS
ncbi:MAG: chordopoxvirus fusion protein [Desulfobacterales bacterium]|nr:chordopoxvirus fusion protein [Desulfobacterales bacterium]